MKKIAIILSFLSFAASTQAQTVTINPVAKLNFCIRDTLVVSYHAGGTFANDNVFKAQLSDSSGSFESFTTFGSDSTSNGSIAISVNEPGDHFRIRIISTDPYLVSADNGIDLVVNARPSPPIPGIVLVGDWLTYLIYSSNPVTVVNRVLNIATDSSLKAQVMPFWEFGQDASVASDTLWHPMVSYLTPGVKTCKLTITNKSGCDTSATMDFTVLGCHPVIPKNARIVTDNEQGGDTAVWVKPGGSYTTTSDGPAQTVFVEAGGAAIANASQWNTYYIKTGGSVSIGKLDNDVTVVFSTGMSISTNSLLLDSTSCDNLDFDYSLVNAGVTDNPPPSNITILQSGDHLFANDEGFPIEIRISNLLGAEVLSQTGNGSLDVDLSAIPAGMYFAVIEAGNDREVKRIAVVH